MVRLHHVLQARGGDRAMKDKIFRAVFYDKRDQNISKVRKWLKRKGVKNSELADVESRMFESFSEILMRKYVDERIPFEIFVWIDFKMRLMNFWRSKRTWINSCKVSIDQHVDEDGEHHDIQFAETAETPDSIAGDLQIDFERLISKFTFDEKAICRLMYYKGWSFERIMQHRSHYTERLYKLTVRKLKERLRKYIFE